MADKQKSKHNFDDNLMFYREYVPINIIHDRRIAKGSTHAAMVIPAGTYPDTIFA